MGCVVGIGFNGDVCEFVVDSFFIVLDVVFVDFGFLIIYEML